MKQMVKVATLLSLSAATLLASGYRIPEQSLNGTALGAAYVAGASGADASYYNPANMAFMGNGAEIETSLTYINLPKIDYAAAGVTPAGNASGDSLKEQFLMPSLHYVSPMMGNWRYGLSIVAPAGLSKRWDESYQMRSSEEFTLQVVEINPTASYLVNEQFAVAFGLRGVYTTGEIKVTRAGVYDNEMEADSIDFGYNLAMSYKPMNDLTLSATYRSKVDLTVEGDATTNWLGAPVSGGVSTQVPLPASLALAAAYKMDKTTVELVFERTYWSSYGSLDFQFENATAEASALGAKKDKNWKDVNAYRLGISHQYNDNLKLMAGFAIDKTPAPDSTLGFELPDSDAKLYSAGIEYKINEKLKLGLAYLYSDKESRTVDNSVVNGTFSEGGAHLVTTSLKYKF